MSLPSAPRLKTRDLVGAVARSLHEAVCEDLLEGPTAFEGEPDRIRAEVFLLRIAERGYVLSEARQQGRDQDLEIVNGLPRLQHRYAGQLRTVVLLDDLRVALSETQQGTR